MMKFTVLVAASIIFFRLPQPAFAQSTQPAVRSLSLEAYLEEVRSAHGGFAASLRLEQGALARLGEAELLTSPNLFAELQRTDDRLPATNAAFKNDRSLSRQLSLGITEQTRFGLSGTLTYNLLRSEIVGANPQLVPEPDVFASTVTFELTQSLWRNGFGSATRARERALEAGARALAYQEVFRQKQILANAEISYFQLAIARRIFEVQEESLNRAQTIRDSNSRRRALNLIENTDLLQSEAALRAREFDVTSARHQMRQTSRAFNILRGIDSDAVSEKLSLPTGEQISALLRLSRADDRREDVRAAEQTLEARVAQAEGARSESLPAVDLFAQFTTSAREVELGAATRSSLEREHPRTVIGLRLSMPLDQFKASRVRSGYESEIAGARSEFERRLFEQESEWKDIRLRIAEANERLGASMALENAQKEKFLNERNRQGQGRSTTFQVLTFEQEYLLSQVNKLRIQSELLALLAQLKLYTGSAK